MAYIIDSKINSRSYLNNPDATVSAKDFQSGIAGAGRTYGEMYGNSIELLYTPDYNQRMDTLGKAILQVYAQNGVGNNVSSPYKYAIDSLISNLYGISLAEATRKHKSFVRAFTGEELEDKSLIEAFADSWRSDTINSQIARLQNDFTDSEDEEERAMLRKKIEKLQYEQIKLGDYSDRGWLGNSVVASAPLFKQIAEMALYTAGGNYLSAGLGLLAQGTGLATKAAKLIETSKLISKAAKVGKFASKAVGGIGGAAYWLTSLYPTMKGLADLQLYELEDYAGRKLDDETRNRASTLIALAQVALNIITPEPAFNKFLCNKVFSGKINDIISSKVSNMILQRGVEALVGATFESLEEGGEDFVYSLGEDIVKAYSNETGDTAFDIPSAGDSLGKALSSAANTFKDMFLPSLLVGGLGQGIEFAGDYMSHKVEMAERNEAPLSPEETNSAQDRQQATERSQTVRTGKLVFKRKAPSKSFMDSISEMDGEGNSHAKREKLPPVKVQRVFKWGHEYLEPVDNYNKDLAKYLRNQGVDAIMVEVEDNAEMSSTSADIGNIAKSFDGTFDAETDTIYIKPEATSNFRMTLEEEGFIVNRTEEGELSFSYTDENNQRHTISIVEDEELAGRQTNTTTETEEEMAFQEEEFAESVDESVAETDTTGNPDLQPDERRTGDGDFDSTENINTTQTEDTETLRRDRREKISRAVTKATKGRINPTDSRTLASLFDYMTPEVQSAILKENPDGTFIIDEQEMQKRFGKSLPKNKRGATILNRLQMVLSPRSDATTFVHESVHLAGAANPQLFADLAMSYLDAVTDPVESENLMKFLDENRRITGKEANEAFEILSSLPEDGRFSEEQEELASNVFVAALRAYDENSDSYYNLPAPIMRAYRAIASLIKNIYQGITGRTRLPKAVMDSYSRFFFSLEGTSETPDIQTQRRDIEASLFSTKLTSDTLADIDSLSKNDIGKPNVTIRFSAHTPVVFQALGMRDLPVEAYRDKMARSTLLSPSNDHGHNDSVNIEILKAVADMFGNPLFVFDSSSRKGDFVAVYPILGINENHTPVMISIHPDASANRIEVNLITSFYAKDNENTFKNWTDQGLLRYVDDINNSEVALAVRLQLPSGVTTSSNFNILRKSSLVKDRIRYQEYLPPEDKIEIRYQSYSSEDLTEREKTRSGMKMYQRISHEELSSLIDDNVYVPSYVLQYKASETRADGTNPNAELNQKIRQEIAAREMMATLPKYMRKMAIDAENAEAFVSVVEEKNRKDHKKLPDAEGRFLLKRYYSYVNNPSGREMIADFKRTFANREGIIRLRDKLISSTVSRSVVRNEKGRLERKRIRTFRTPANELVARLARLSRRSTENELDSAIAEIEKNPIPYMAEYYRMLARNREPLPYGFRNPIGLINQLYMKDDDYQFLRIDSQVATLFDEIYDDPVIAEAYNLGEDVMRSVMTPYEEVEEMRNATDETISADINETKENFKAVRNSLNFATKKLKELQRDYEKAMDTISGLWLDDEVQRLTLNQGNIERLQEISDAITEEAEKLYHDHPELQLSEDSLGNYTGRASHQINRELPYSEQLDQLLSKHKAYLDMVTNVRLNEKLDKQGRMLTDRMKQQHDDLWEKINTARDEAHRNLVAYNRYYRKYTTLLRNHLRQKIDRNIKKRLAFNSSTHDVMLEDVVYWLYYYMHDGQHRMFSNSEVLTDEDYDILRFARGEVDEKGFDVAMYKLDSNGNPVDGQPPFEGNLGSYRFHQDQMPSLLSDILPESLKEKVATTRYADLSLEDRQAILNGLSLARKRAKDRYESIRDARNNQLRESENRMTARIFGENFIYNTTEEDIEIVKARIPGRDYDNMSQEDLAALVQDFKRKHPGLFFTAKELEPGLKGKLKGALDTVSLWFMMIEPFVRKLDGKLYGVFHEEFIDKPMRAYQDKIRQKGRRLEDADNLFSSTLGDKGSKKRKENLSWLREEHGGFNYNDLKKGKRSLTGNQMLGAYVYSQNINGFKNLYSSEGNSLSLESLARINPLAIQQVIEAELRTRAEYEADRIYRETNGLVPQVYTPTLLYRETNAHLNELLRKIQNGEIASVLPESMRKLGDGMIDLLAKEQQRYADVVYDVYNQKMVFQERYFPLIADAKMAPGTNVGEDGHKGSKMPFAGNKELRDKNAVYPLVLNPIATFLSAIETQENFINMSKPVRNLNSMMSEHGGGLKPMLTNRYGEKYVKFLENYIGRLAGGTEKLDDMERLVNRFLGNIAVSKISLNLMTSLKQITSIIPALTDGEISVNNLASAFYEMAMSKDKVYDTVDSLAPEIMTSEMNLEYQRLHEASLGDPLSGKFSAIREFGMKPVEAVDHMVKVAVWYASFEKNIEYGMNEQEAASRASSLVQRTQSMSDPFSLSEAQAHRNPFYRAVFLFTNDLFHMWNILFGHAWSDWQEGNRWNAFRRFGGAIASAALLSFLAMGWAPDDDDDKNFDEREFGRDFISNMLQYMTPGIGHLWQDALGGFPRETWGIMKELAQTGRMFTNLEDYNGEEIAGQILDVATEATAPLGMPIIMADRTINVFKPENGGSLAFNPFYFFGSNTGDAMDVWFGLNDLMD